MRKAADKYYTPDELARFIVRRTLSEAPKDLKILEPSAGGGAFLRALTDDGFTDIIGVEPFREQAIWPENVAWWKYQIENCDSSCGFDIIIGNPPYSLAQQHVEKCLELLAPGGMLVFLLRLAFLETKKRAPFWKENPCFHVDVLSERPSFTWSWKCKKEDCEHGWTDQPEIVHKVCPECGDSELSVSRTDSTAYGIFTWVDGRKDLTTLDVVSWK